MHIPSAVVTWTTNRAGDRILERNMVHLAPIRTLGEQIGARFNDFIRLCRFLRYFQ